MWLKRRECSPPKAEDYYTFYQKIRADGQHGASARVRTVVRQKSVCHIYLSDVGSIMKVVPVWFDRKNYNVVSVSA